MKQNALISSELTQSSSRAHYSIYLLLFLAGLLGPLGFAPFHIPGLMILSLSLLFAGFINHNRKECFILGMVYGLGYFGFGVSWVIISIHDYGQLNYFCAGVITLIFIVYLSLYPACVGYFLNILSSNQSKLRALLCFSALWCLSEYLRSNLMTGFPWLLIGTTQIDTPLRHLAPVIGLYGLGFLCALCAGLLTYSIRENTVKRFFFLTSFVLLIISPALLKHLEWTFIDKKPITVGVVQANLSMRDKWDETLFWNLLKYYEQATDKLMGKQLIILPESAIPLPASYLNDYLQKIHRKAIHHNSAIMLGILKPTDDSESHYYNSILTLGTATGTHIKRQLVPFGEYIPGPFVAINRGLNLPEPNISPGKQMQSLIKILHKPIASLICYEIAYPNLLRQQMPQAQWIVSISDNGWFGRSLASYQQLQMSQILSLLTGRYQVVVNNDGLSSVINDHGDIVDGLPPFTEGILQSEIFPAEGSTPWVYLYEYPALILSSICLLFLLYLQLRRIRKQ